jgi:lipid II:glycine glycyltransferase (peptidoglycan interpeptide bridge formation enzyme)
MNLNIREIDDKEIWENFLLECKEKTFLDSWNWGEFQKSLGNKIWRIGIFDNENLLGLALVVKIEAKRGKFLFIPHGPNLKIEDKEKKLKLLRVLRDELERIAKGEDCDFIRISPILKKTKENEEIFSILGFKNAPIFIHPEITWELNIEKSEEDILAGMRKTTRYLIKKAQKEKLLTIREENSLEGVSLFNKIYLETKERQHFVPFSLEYLQKEFLAFKDEDQVSILLGDYKGEIIAGGIFIFWQNLAFYHHGASSRKYSKIPTSYLLLWEAIKKAKQKGCKVFNFWGIAPTDSSKHPWAGLTLFKIGFGGEKKEYVKTKDLPLKKKYWINYIVESLRKWKRRY